MKNFLRVCSISLIFFTMLFQGIPLWAGDSKPAATSIGTTKSVYSPDESVVMNWQTVSNATTYDIHLYKDSTRIEIISGLTGSSYSRKLPSGNYRIQIFSVNSAGWTAGKSAEFKVGSVSKPSANPSKNLARHFWQKDPAWGLPWGGCVITSYAMLVNYYRGDITPYDVYLKNNKSVSVVHARIADGFQMKFTQVLYRVPYTRERLIKSFNQYPQGIVVYFIRKYGPNNHAMLMVGYDDETIYFHDPALQNGAYIPYNRTSIKQWDVDCVTIWVLAPK